MLHAYFTDIVIADDVELELPPDVNQQEQTAHPYDEEDEEIFQIVNDDAFGLDGEGLGECRYIYI